MREREPRRAELDVTLPHRRKLPAVQEVAADGVVREKARFLEDEGHRTASGGTLACGVADIGSPRLLGWLRRAGCASGHDSTVRPATPAYRDEAAGHGVSNTSAVTSS